MSKSSFHALLERKIPFTTAEANRLGISTASLYRATARKEIERIRYGIYRVSNTFNTFENELIIVSKRVPLGVFCTITALAIHGLTTQISNRINVALPRKTYMSKITSIEIQYHVMQTEIFEFGIEHCTIFDTDIRVYSIARTIADCFKYRHKIGLDIALEALRDALQKNRVTIGEILQAAKICRVEKIITPYIEAQS